MGKNMNKINSMEFRSATVLHFFKEITGRELDYNTKADVLIFNKIVYLLKELNVHLCDYVFHYSKGVYSEELINSLEKNIDLNCIKSIQIVKSINEKLEKLNKLILDVKKHAGDVYNELMIYEILSTIVFILKNYSIDDYNSLNDGIINRIPAAKDTNTNSRIAELTMELYKLEYYNTKNYNGSDNDEEIVFKYYVLDNVHGNIGLTDVEHEIEQLPLFQRLRRIKQLGFGNLVFPGAEHTRYAHSLGVMHIADKMAIQLKLTKEQRKTIRLAGLLHDIGHYPFSHSGEQAYKNLSDIYFINDEIVENNQLTDLSFDIQKKNKAVVERIKNIGKVNKHKVIENYMIKDTISNSFHHENIAGLIISNNKTLKRLIEKAGCDYKQISQIIKGIVERDLTTDPKIESKEILKIYIQLLHSEFDADRIDYLLRDSFSAGTSYGINNVDSLINSLEIKKIKNNKIICFKQDSVAIADQFLINRHFAYNQVVYNKNVTVMNYMIEQVIMWLATTKDCEDFYSPSDLLNDVNDSELVEKYCDFTDEYVLNYIKTVYRDREQYSMPKSIETFMRHIVKYRFPETEGKYSKYDITLNSSQLKLSKENSIRKIIEELKLLVDKNVLIVFGSSELTKHKKNEEFNRLHSDYVDDITKSYDDEFIKMTHAHKKITECCNESTPMDELHNFCNKLTLDSAKLNYSRIKIDEVSNLAIDRLVDSICITNKNKEPTALVDVNSSIISTLANNNYYYFRVYDLED